MALLGKVMTVGDTVSLLPRDLGPGTSTSAASSALAAQVGITWTSELLTVTGVDPAGPVSVQPNSVVTWGDGTAGPIVAQPTFAPEPAAAPAISVDDLRGMQAQVARLSEWLKLALDEPKLLETLGATANLGVLVTGPAGVGKATMVRAVCAIAAADRVGRARDRRAARRGSAAPGDRRCSRGERRRRQSC